MVRAYDGNYMPYIYDPFSQMLEQFADFKPNPYHPLVFIHGNPEIGKDVYIGLFSEINAKGGIIVIGENCDIASFVSINVADSHEQAIGIGEMKRGRIILGDHVFVGSHSFIGGDTTIGHHSVIGAGSIITNREIPPYSLVVHGRDCIVIKQGYFTDEVFRARNQHVHPA